MFKGKKGFTLVELLVVIAIIAVISAVAVPAVVGQITKAKIGTALDEAQKVRTSVTTALTDVALKDEVRPDNFAEAMNNEYTEMKQCTDIKVKKIDNNVHFMVFTKVPVDKDKEDKSYIAAKINEADDVKYLTVQMVVQGKDIKFGEGIDLVHIVWGDNGWAPKVNLEN